jgi:hypothetical protein
MASIKPRPEGLDQPLVPPPKRAPDRVTQVAYLLLGAYLLIGVGLIIFGLAIYLLIGLL